ncbi:MAG: exosortase H [Cellvibrionaceae bacterium]|nr:exosortase H [Cellvibrionaceae bacterium]MCV6626584.1 exosortase H [Cellvibrionaceae bacterium]
MLRYSAWFFGLMVVLFGIEMLNPVQQNVILPFTAFIAKICAAIVTPFDASVLAYGKILQSSINGFAVSIEPGCNGVEATIMLVAAAVAFPSTIKQKFAVVVFGFIAIQIANILRIISLFYLGQWNMEIFEWAHLYLWPVLIMVDVLAVFLIWLRIISKDDPSQPAEASAA